MISKLKSRYLLKKFLDEFDLDGLRAEGVSNLEYLDFQLSRLEKMKDGWECTSRDPSVTVKVRARARDLSQNAEGLISGIKFGISFILHKDQDLNKDIPGVKPTTN